MSARVLQHCRWPGAALALALALPACLSELVVEVQPAPPDAGEVDASAPEEDAAVVVEDEDAGSLDPGDASIPPMSEPDAARPPLDAQVPDAVVKDSGAQDATTDSDIVVLITTPADAGACEGGKCDADTGPPPSAQSGPCSGCDGITLLQATCESGAKDLCWTNADGTCTRQCPPVKSCSASVGCAADEYCYFAAKDCGKSGVPGFCAKRLKTCFPGGDPVCGCNGLPYENACFANKDGTPAADIEPGSCR